MENTIKDKEYELTIGTGDVTGSIKIKNSNNRVFAQIGDIVVDALSYFRWSNAVIFLDKYNKKKISRGIIGKETPLPPKFLIEILNNAFQEDEEEIQDSWNDLLINWQDLEKKCDRKYMYIEILKNLDINEIKLLKIISKDPNFKDAITNQNYYYESNKIGQMLSLSKNEIEIMILNLYRLKVCDSLKSEGGVMSIGSLSVRADAGTEKFRLTAIGYELLKNLSD